MDALQQAKLLVELAQVEGGAASDKIMGDAMVYAAIAQAEVAERQAAAMERIAAELVRVADGLHPTCEWPDESDVDAHNQRAEDSASYNAGIAGGLHR